MAISDDWTIDLSTPSIRRIYHSSGTTVYSMNQLYSYLMDFFDESDTIDDTIPMTAQTPTSYTLINSWFINYAGDTTDGTNPSPYPSFKYLNGGSLTTTGWTGTTYATGIRLLTFNSSGYVSATAGDIGKTVSYAGGSPSDSGVLLDIDNTLRKWWVRLSATTSTFANTGTQIQFDAANKGTLAAASVTGENTWANPYTLGTILANTQINVIQSDARVIPWWTTGHIDILLCIKQAGTIIDYSYANLLARQYTGLYDHYLVDLSGGARTPIPLATTNDINNNTGYRTFTGTGGSGTFQVGEIISYSTTAYGIVTAVNSYTLTYYLYLYPFTDFVSSNAVIGNTSGATCTAADPSNTGPAGYSGITFTFANTAQNLNNGNGSRPYSVIVNCNNYSLANVYEYLKFYTRYGNTTTLNGHDAEQYYAIGDLYVPYDAQSSAFVEGETITGAVSAASGVIVSDQDLGASGNLVLRDVAGTFRDNENIMSGATVRAVANIPSGATTISPVKQSPFGTFAGGQFFGARGVWLSNIPTADANNFELIDTTNTRQVPPTTITVTVSGVASGDRVGVFKATGSNNTVEKSQFTLYAGQSAGVGYIRVTGSAPSDTPSSGSLCVVGRNSSGSILNETRYAYTAWADNTTYTEFTLSVVTSVAYDTYATAYVPYLDAQASGTSVSVNLTYVTGRYVTTRVRRLHYLPFLSSGQITASGLTVAAIKTADTIAD